jgi:hypothetical protein
MLRQMPVSTSTNPTKNTDKSEDLSSKIPISQIYRFTITFMMIAVQGLRD